MKLPCPLLFTLLLPFVAAADYADHPRAKALYADDELAAVYTTAELRTLLAAARRVPKLIEAEQQAAEKTRSWTEYRAIFLQDWRIQDGVAFWREHRAALEWARELYGVPPQIITAIIGVETRYGGYTGPHRVLDSLATQGLEHPTRSPFFFKELREFLLACREFGWDPLAIQGSYAGAMGLAQFMPSNYRRLALDFDHDGRTDLWTAPDAIGSAANYLANFRGEGRGWQAGKPVALPARYAPGGLTVNSKSAPYRWRELEPQVQLGAAAPAEDAAAGLIHLEAEDGPQQWLALENFYNLMAYNPRVYYATAVFELSEAIRRAAQPDG